jgi:hypothetical protein
VSNLYESFLERDSATIRGAISEFRKTHSLEELFADVARFAVLAYAPSQHAKHAVLACLAVHDLGLTDELLTECAIYAAGSRQPWSEPPITDPPEQAASGDIAELRAAIADDDRLRGERWLSKRLDDPQPDYFLAATDDFEDLGHKLIVASAAWKLAGMFPPAARFATLRIGIWEMTAYRGERYGEQGVALDAETLMIHLIENLVAQKGDIVSAHAIFLLDAALETQDARVILRVRDYLSNLVEDSRPRLSGQPGAAVLHHYAFARDYGAYLKMHAVAKRMRVRFPSLDYDGMLAAAAYNLEHAPSFEEFSFA